MELETNPLSRNASKASPLLRYVSDEDVIDTAG
jgi:hypothetical protein